MGPKNADARVETEKSWHIKEKETKLYIYI